MTRGGADIWDTPQASIVLADDVFYADVFVKGSLVAIEFAADTANFTAGVEIHGDFTVSEVGDDSFTSLPLTSVTIGTISVSVAAVTLLAKKLTLISEQSATIHKFATLAAKVTNYG